MAQRPVLWWRGFWAGAAGGAVAVGTLFAYRFATGVPTLQEALAERMIRLLPYQVFALILAKLQHLAKPLGFVMAVVTLVVGFGIGGGLYAWAGRRSPRPPLWRGLLTALITWLFLTVVFLPLIQSGILGTPLTTVVPSPALPMALASLAYGLVLAAIYGRPRGAAAAPAGGSTGTVPPAEGVAPATASRRDFLRRTALVVLAAAAGTRLAGWTREAGARVYAAAAGVFRLVKGMPPEVTPNGQFYQISKNFFDPTVDVAHWTLQVTGMVDKPQRFSLDDFIKAAPPVERYQTFECISNEVGGDLINNAKWKGVRMKDILAPAGVQSGATTVIMRAADGYSESVPLAVAMDPESLLAYEMNGERIPQKHGTPVRVLFPNRYGMKQPKWLTSIELANRDFTGYWEQQGWSKDAFVKVNSAFRVETTEGGMLVFGGWAFAGNRGIAHVEISPDDGRTWLPAAVKEPLGANCWQFWSAEWKPPAPGTYTVQVRATDGQGRLQPVEPRPTLPDGGQGYHTIRVKFG